MSGDLRPYYADDFVTLYHGDCRLLLPLVAPTADLLLADPPYGMDHEPTRRSNGSKRWAAERVQGDGEPFDPAHLLVYPRMVLFGAHWYADRLPASGGWLVWDKTPKGIKDGFTASHADLAWTNCCTSVRKFSLQWGGEARNREPFLHPTQKPVGLMRWVIEQFTEPTALVVDPYMGSGPVLEACRDTRRRYIGIEIEERYCETAARRLSQSLLDFEGNGKNTPRRETERIYDESREADCGASGVGP